MPAARSSISCTGRAAWICSGRTRASRCERPTPARPSTTSGAAAGTSSSPPTRRVQLDGNHYHDHGDLWHGPWQWEVERDDGQEATVYLRRQAVALPCLMEKWITVRRDSLAIEFRHRLHNVGTRAEPYTWSLHVAHAIGPGSRVLLPATRLRWSTRSSRASARGAMRCPGPCTRERISGPCPARSAA